MKVAKIADLEALADGTVIGEMVVQLKSVFPANTGTNANGPWRSVNGIIKDSTGEGRITFWTDDDYDDLVGQTITIKSTAGSKGLNGIRVKQNKKTSKMDVSISKAANVIGGTRNALEQYTDAVKVNTQLAQAKGTVTDAKRLLFQKAQLYVECVKAADWIRSQHELTQDHFQAVVASLFISADKQNLANCFPVEAVKGAKQKADPDEIPMDFEAADAAAKPKDELEEELGW